MTGAPYRRYPVKWGKAAMDDWQFDAPNGHETVE
jgi:hypothetical protein